MHSNSEPGPAPRGIRRVNDEVYYADAPLVAVSAPTLEWLKARALANPRRRARLCAHPDPDDRLHEMIIVHTRETYVRAHRHVGKTESYHVLEGSADLVFLDDEGQVTEVVALGANGPGRAVYCRTAGSRFHTLLIRSDVIVFHETTNGPFRREDTLFASWAPEESDPTACEAFMKRVERETGAARPSGS